MPEELEGVNQPTVDAAPPQTTTEQPTVEGTPDAQLQQPESEMIPRTRLNEVIEERNSLREQFDQFKSQQEESFQQEVERRVADTLNHAAYQNPQLRPLLWGEEPRQGAEAPADDENLTAEQKRINQLEGTLSEVQTRLGLYEQNTRNAEMANVIDTQMRKYPLFNNEAVSRAAEEMILRRIELNPRSDYANVVKTVHDGINTMIKENYEKYEDSKAAAQQNVPAPITAGGGGVPAGYPKPKPAKIDTGEAVEALQKAIEQGGGLKM